MKNKNYLWLGYGYSNGLNLVGHICKYIQCRELYLGGTLCVVQSAIEEYIMSSGMEKSGKTNWSDF